MRPIRRPPPFFSPRSEARLQIPYGNIRDDDADCNAFFGRQSFGFGHACLGPFHGGDEMANASHINRAASLAIGDRLYLLAPSERCGLASDKVGRLGPKKIVLTAEPFVPHVFSFKQGRSFPAIRPPKGTKAITLQETDRPCRCPCEKQPDVASLLVPAYLPRVRDVASDPAKQKPSDSSILSGQIAATNVPAGKTCGHIGRSRWRQSAASAPPGSFSMAP